MARRLSALRTRGALRVRLSVNRYCLQQQHGKRSFRLVIEVCLRDIVGHTLRLVRRVLVLVAQVECQIHATRWRHGMLQIFGCGVCASVSMHDDNVAC